MVWAADSRWLGLLAEYLVKTSAVLCLALAAAALLRRRSAALRHFVLSAFLVGLVLLPLLPSLPAGWETRWLPARPEVRQGSPAADRESRPAATGPATAVPMIVAEPSDGWNTAPVPPGTLVLFAGAEPQGAEKAPASGGGSSWLLESLLPLAWSAGLLVLMLRLGLGLAGAARLSREGRPLDDSVWDRLLRRFVVMVTLRRRVRLKSHGRVAVPMTWGLVRPVILFPEDSRDWDEGRRSAALFHELSHIKRADFAVMLLGRLSLALFWFNPLVWAVLRRLRREQEKACDELVLRAGIKPSAYARSLLLFRRPAAGAWAPSAALLGMSAGSSLNDRLAAILRQKLTIKEVTMRTRIILTIAVLFAVSFIGAARPAAPAVEPPAAASISAAPAPVQEAAAEARQDGQEAVKEKKTEQAEKKAKEKETVTKTIYINTLGANKGQLQITVSDGKETKTLVLDHPVVLEAAGPGGEVTLKLDGKDLVIKKGQKVTIVSKGGSLEVVGEDEIKDLEADVHAHTVVSPVIVTVDQAHPRTVIVEDVKGKPVVIKEVEGQPIVVTAIPAPPAPPAPPALGKATTYEVIEGGKAYTVVLSPRPHATPHASSVAYSVVPAPGLDAARKEIRAELKAIQDEVKKLEQRRPDVSNELKAIEESLRALSEKLEKQAAKLDAYRIKAGVPVEHVTVAAPTEHITVVGKDAAAGEAVGVVYSDAAEKAHVVSVTRGDVGAVTVIYKTGEVLKDEAAVARAVDKVKKAMPQGYSVEPKAEKESGALTLKIKAPEGQKVDEGLVKKVVAILVEEMKKAPEKKD